MSSIELAQRECAPGKAPSRAERIEKRLDRYPARHAAAVRSLAREHFALADLALSFPALLFALAVPRDVEAARRGVAAVCEGRSLRVVAGEIGLPMWLRGLPPEAFAKPVGDLPDGPMFALRIANHLPRSPKRAATWLNIVEAAAHWGDANIAAWIAREFLRSPKPIDQMNLRRVCLWAWISTRPESPASALSRKRWSQRMDFKQALAEARDWLENVEVACILGQNDLDGGWLEPGEFCGYVFSPLLTTSELIAHAQTMRNCVRSYARALKWRRLRIWAVEREGAAVATFEICAHHGGRFACLSQASARLNGELEPDVERAIHEWLRVQPLCEAPKPFKAKVRLLDRATWISLWRPYWLEKRRLPDWLPLAPRAGALARLRE